MGKKRGFGELELAILKLLADRKQLSVREVLETFDGEDKYTTIMTVMNRLVEKQHLIRERCGQHFNYRLNKASRPSHQSLLDRLRQKIFGGKLAPMMSYLIDSGDAISDEELAKMEELIREIRESRSAP